MPTWLESIVVAVGSGIAIAVSLSIPKLWVDLIIVKRETEKHSEKFAGLFNRVDRISEDVSYIRGHIDHLDPKAGKAGK